MRSTEHHLISHKQRRRDFSVVVRLTSMHIEHELPERAFEPRQALLQHDKPRRQRALQAASKIHLSKRFAKLEMLLWLKRVIALRAKNDDARHCPSRPCRRVLRRAAGLGISASALFRSSDAAFFLHLPSPASFPLAPRPRSGGLWPSPRPCSSWPRQSPSTPHCGALRCLESENLARALSSSSIRRFRIGRQSLAAPTRIENVGIIANEADVSAWIKPGRDARVSPGMTNQSYDTTPIIPRAWPPRRAGRCAFPGDGPLEHQSPTPPHNATTTPHTIIPPTTPQAHPTTTTPYTKQYTETKPNRTPTHQHQTQPNTPPTQTDHTHARSHQTPSHPPTKPPRIQEARLTDPPYEHTSQRQAPRRAKSKQQNTPTKPPGKPIFGPNPSPNNKIVPGRPTGRATNTQPHPQAPPPAD